MMKTAVFLIFSFFAGFVLWLAESEQDPILLPTHYMAGLFYVEPVTTEGDTLHLFTDTGGSLYLYSDVAERLSLAQTSITESGRDWEVVSFPSFRPGSAIPPPSTPQGKLPLRPRQENSLRNERDGMLGHLWFRGRTWIFNYEQGQLSYYPERRAATLTFEEGISLFQYDEYGVRKHLYPAISAVVDQDTLRFLFDTGATLILTDSALSELGDGNARRRATSFIVASTFDLWRKHHPEWRVIEKADEFAGVVLGTYEPIIEVPQITVAGQTVGPVWFTRRQDAPFREIATRMVGDDVDGALGGSALQYFKVTVDYLSGVAKLEGSE